MSRLVSTFSYKIYKIMVKLKTLEITCHKPKPKVHNKIIKWMGD